MSQEHSAAPGLDIVLLHAFPCDGSLWAEQARALADSGHRVLTPDLRGFGDAPLGDDLPDLDRMADDVVALLDSGGIGSAVIGGMSMGGYVAMSILRRFPDRVAALVLADTKATADSPEALANRHNVAARVLAEGSPILSGMVGSLVGPTTMASRPHVVRRVEGWLAGARPEAVAWAQRAMAARPDSLEVLAAYDRPALVVWGDEDALSPAAEQQLMLDALRHGRGAQIPGSGHLTAVETPTELSAILCEFAGSVAPG